MIVTCCIKNCKSMWKNSEIKFYRFQFQNEITIKYWIAATGRNNWFSYSGAQICSLHFKDTNYSTNIEDIKRKYLKPDKLKMIRDKNKTLNRNIKRKHNYKFKIIIHTPKR
ncbi:hypothetical protein ACFW04_014456 [Cataglyphis niger]